MAPARRAASVVWELSEEGTVVVDVDAPVRPFGAVPTPARGTLLRDELSDFDDFDDFDDPTSTDARVERRAEQLEGRKRTLPPL